VRLHPQLTRLLPALLAAFAIFTATAEGNVSPAEHSLLSSVQVGQASLFRQLDAGLARAVGKSPGAVRFRRGERSFAVAVQRAGTRLLEHRSAAAFFREATRAEHAWRARSGGLPLKGRTKVFIHALATAEIAFWRGIADTVRTHETSSAPSSRAAIDNAGAIFATRFQRAVVALLKGARSSQGRQALLELVGVGMRSFSASLDVGAEGFANTANAPNDQGPPPPAPPSAPPAPSPAPQATQLALHCPKSAHVNETLKISGTLAPAPAGASVELLYYPPPYTGVESSPIIKHLGVAPNGEFSDASVTPEAEGGGAKGSLEGTWIVEARYAGSALYSSPLPNQCDIQVEP
jgi:hypothetical protein